MYQQLLVVLALACLAWAVQRPYKLVPIQGNPGMYFEHINTLSSVKESWRIVIHKNIETISFNHEKLIHIIDDLEERTEKLPFMSHLVKNLDVLTQRISMAYDTLTTMLEKDSQSIDNKVFSTPPSISAVKLNVASPDPSHDPLFDRPIEEYMPRIKSMFNIQQGSTLMKNLRMHIIKGQTFIHHVDAKETVSFPYNINKNYWIYFFERESESKARDMIELINDITAYVKEQGEEISNFLNTITLAKQQKLAQGLINQNWLKSILRQIQESSTESILPLRIDFPSLNSLAEVSEITAVYNAPLFLIEVKIPLMDKATEEIYRINPLPTFFAQNKGKIKGAYIIPKEKFIIANIAQELYSLALSNPAENCKRTQLATICPNKYAINNAHTEPSCESDALFKRDKVNTRLCDVAVILDTKPYWKPLTEKSGYYYSSDRTLNVSLNCKYIRKRVEIAKGAGTFMFHSDCTVKFDNTIFLSSTQSLDSTAQVFTGSYPLNISQLSDCPGDEDYLNEVTENSLPIPNSARLDAILQRQSLISIFKAKLALSISLCSAVGILVTICTLAILFNFWQRFIKTECKVITLTSVIIGKPKPQSILRTPLPKFKNVTFSNLPERESIEI